MIDNPSMNVEFDIHGAACHGCDLHIMTIHQPLLTAFSDAHRSHSGFSFICAISSPPEMASERLMEIAFSQK